MQPPTRQAVALFRYGLIAPVLYAAAGTQVEYFRRLAARELEVPGLGPRRYSVATFKSWLRSYRRRGLEGLTPKIRSDAGSSRLISPQLTEHIRRLLADSPILSATRLREKLVASGHITSSSICEATLRRHIRQARLRPPVGAPQQARKHFEKPYANDLWVLDFMHGPRLLCPPRKRATKTFLAAALDDHSRFAVLARFYERENTAVVVCALKQAFLRHGLPRVLYCDNGSAFSSQLLSLACARLGVALVHSQPYDAASRGKVERWFRTVRSSFLAELDAAALSLDQLNERFAHWVDRYYHRRPHSSTAQTPLERFLRSLGSIRARVVTAQQLDRIFYRTLWRTVRNDATVSIGRKLWEVPPRYIGHRIEIRHPEGRAGELFLFEDDQPVVRLVRVDAAQNASTPRRPRFAIQDEED